MNNAPVIRASFWSFAGFGAGQLFRLVGNLALTRLLAPEAFGLMALIIILLQGLEMFTDMGLTQSLIQNRRGENTEFRNTAWILKIVRGVAIAVCFCLIAYPFAHFYNEPALWALVTVMALAPLSDSFGSTAPSLANRNLWLGRLTLLTLTSQALGIIVMVVWAMISPSAWALVAGNVIQRLAYSFLSHWLFPWWPNRLQWDSHAAREIVRFGKWVFLTSVLAFVAGQIDRLTLAKLVPLDLVGVYSIGFMWAMLPLQIVQVWMNRILFPIASRIFRDGGGSYDRLTTYRRRAIWLSSIGVGLFGGLITPVYRFLYPPEYWQATEFLQIILLGALVALLDAPYRSFNMAIGQPTYVSLGAALAVLIFATAVIPLYMQFSAYGIAMAFSISQIGALGADIYGVRKAGLTDLKVDVAAALSGLAVWAALYWATASLR